MTSETALENFRLLQNTPVKERRKDMNNEEYKKYIMEMLAKIDDNQHLKRIFNYTHKYFLEDQKDERKN